MSTTGDQMLSQKMKMLSAVAVAGATIFALSMAEAKGPRGAGNSGGVTEVAPGVSHGNGAQSDTWTAPSGWSQGGKSGWNGSSEPPGWTDKQQGGGTWTTPPGWDQGNKSGWDAGTVPPGFDEGKKQGWQTEVVLPDATSPNLPPGLKKKQ